ncbi:MAG TPA: dihydrolipoamide acetyltransferase family protein [Candidatus Limnocylindria bacterium]|jgi:pyruvate dehydrogenase E2 component (dihydrolipoamide acetyltransferase)|nr:dihydrolipoamide acetyltransferase family protein [Candidatus Limnocylindria bacterium]
MAEFRMPSLGADMTTGTLRKWYVKPGDHVSRGDVVAVVETEKAAIDVEIYEAGVIEQLVAEPGQQLPVGGVLATLRADGAPRGWVRASPAARKLARERGIDLAAITGSGPHGAIERADVERITAATEVPLAAPAPPPIPPPPTLPPPTAPTPERSGIRHAIALATARSNREIPHYYLETRIDMRASLLHLEQLNAQRPIRDRILPAALLLKAVARAPAAVPALNGYWLDDGPQLQEGIHLGVAVALRQGGLVIPAIHDVDTRPLDDVMAAMRDVITRARAGRLKSSEVTDATITVTNLGDLGVETVYGVIYPPQIALVGFGRITEQPWADAGMLGIRPVLHATLAADHRATDGHQGAQFLTSLAQLLGAPQTL